MSPRLSVLVETRGEHADLPVFLVDLDSYMQRMNLSYEVFILSSSAETKSVVQKFSKIIKSVEFKCVGGSEVKDVSSVAKGSLYVMFRDLRVPSFESVKEFVNSLHSKENPSGAELSFAYYEDSSLKGIFYYILGRLMGVPVRLDCRPVIIGFTGNISSLVLNSRQFTLGAFEIELALLSQKMGYKIAKTEVRPREGDKPDFNYAAALLVWESVKVRVLMFWRAYSLKNSARKI